MSSPDYMACGDMAWFFALTLFTSAALMFSVQPMVGKMLLPLLGGAPAVWNTCLVFFQATLLAGYAYAHLLSTRLSMPGQKLVHLGLMLATCAALPIGFASDEAVPWNSNPVPWLVGTLALAVGLPFFTVSGSAPLLQSWFSHTRHRSSRDPYFLYAASNMGSLLGLIAYPTLIEPQFALRDQTRLWMFVYFGLALFFLACALMAASKPGEQPPAATPARLKAEAPGAGAEVGWIRRLKWMFWAFLPTSLMLGVTTYLTTDIASVPLLWTVPLTIYLMTFILAFNRWWPVPVQMLQRLLPVNAVALVFVMLAGSDELAWLQIALHLGFFFCAGLVWHARLANDRPPSRSLTDFYFCISVGGVMGGFFSGLLAPMMFRTVVEYPLLIVLACIRWPEKLGVVAGRHSPEATCQRGFETPPAQCWITGLSGVLWPLGIGLLTASLAIVAPRLGLEPHARTMAVFGVPVILCYMISKRGGGLEFALAIGAVLAGSQCYTATTGRTLLTDRNFFGTLRVTRDSAGGIYSLYHGTTVHGMQFVDPNRQTEPLAYYHPSGPCGQALHALNTKPGLTNVAVIGLGSGAMACYGQRGQRWTFYEIDPLIIRLARDSEYFSYLRHATNAATEVIEGDARLRLREAGQGQFDLLVCDAFGSDAPPLHLFTREAMQLYLAKLSDHGVLLCHISSRYLDFRPVLAGLARHFQLLAFEGSEENLTEEMLRSGILPCQWVVLSRRLEDLAGLETDPRWRPLTSAQTRLWTDDYSDILRIFQWQ